jgi:hypothetical protein
MGNKVIIIPIDFSPSRTVHMPEVPRKEEVCLPVSKNAPVIIDIQNGLVKKGGTLLVSANSISAMGGLDQALILGQSSSLYSGDVARTVDGIVFRN